MIARLLATSEDNLATRPLNRRHCSLWMEGSSLFVHSLRSRGSNLPRALPRQPGVLIASPLRCSL
jgi:hypothetical protein